MILCVMICISNVSEKDSYRLCFSFACLMIMMFALVSK